MKAASSVDCPAVVQSGMCCVLILDDCCTLCKSYAGHGLRPSASGVLATLRRERSLIEKREMGE